ncbi:response regulator [bacterium]|nr:response regulator [bacterium]
MRILVVDDSITMRRIIVNNLKSAGFTDVVQAANGVEALSQMNGVELVLTDWNMPVMDGLTLVKEIRASAAFGNVPIVMITTEGAREEVLEALRSGVNDYIVKPFPKQVLIEKVQSMSRG